jgi:hypothetical protein
VVCNFDGARQPNGNAYLTRQCGGDVADHGLIGVTVHSAFSLNLIPKYALDSTTDLRDGSQINGIALI